MLSVIVLTVIIMGVFRLNVIVLCVIALTVTITSVVRLNDVMLSVALSL